MTPPIRDTSRSAMKRSLEEPKPNDESTLKDEKKRILESDIFAYICLPTGSIGNSHPPTKKSRPTNPRLGETSDASMTDLEEYNDIGDNASIASDDSESLTNGNTISNADDNNGEELEHSNQPISSVASRTSSTLSPAISAVAKRHAKKAAEAAIATTTTETPISDTDASRPATTGSTMSALAARHAKKAAEATIATTTETPISDTDTSRPATTVSTMSALAARRAKKAAEAITATTTETPISDTDTSVPATTGSTMSALAARRAKKAAAAKAGKQSETHASISITENQQVSSTTTANTDHSDRVPGKIFDSPPQPALSSLSDIYDSEGAEEFTTPNDELADGFITPNEQLEAEETMLENESQEHTVSWKSEVRKRKTEWKETNKLMDPYSVSTYAPVNAIPFEHEGDVYWCIGFEKGQKLVFIGYSLIGALYGSVDIGGYTISATHDIPTQLDSEMERSSTVSFFPVFSPRTSALAVVQSIPYAKAATVSPSSTLTSTYSDLNPLLESLLPRLDMLESIIIVKNMQWCGVSQLELINPTLKNIFSLGTKKDFVVNDGAVYEGTVGFQPIVRITPEVRAMQVMPSWSANIDNVLEYEDDSLAPSVSLVCGTKNVGKSSFARYMINRLLNTHQRVAYLETDVGQTEFTPSGIVSLHIVESPLLGPPFTHPNLKAKRSFFIGSASPKNDTVYYHDCIDQLLEIYRKEYNTSNSDNDTNQSELVPLVVNSCGWTKGLGYDLLLDVATKVAPTHVFVFSPGDAIGSGLPYNFEDQVIEAAQKSALPELRPVVFFAMHVPAMALSKNQQQQQQSLATTFSQQQRRLIAPSTMADKFTAADHRSLMLFSYMYHDPQAFGTRQEGRGWWNVNPRLVSRLPWTIDWRHHLHGVWLLFEDVPPSMLLYALNGSLVGLVGKMYDKMAMNGPGDDNGVEGEFMEMKEQVAAQPESTKLDEDSQSRSETIPIKYKSPMTCSPPNPHSTHCYGVGIIRGIDAEQHRFHLLTPLPLEQLRHVDSLVKGDLEIPVHLMFDHHAGSRHQNCGINWRQVPYLSHDVIDSIGSSAPRLRRNLMRRSQNID